MMRFDSETGLPFCMLGESEHAIARYWSLISDGLSPGMATMAATKQAPAGRGDTSFFSGGMGNLEQMGGTEWASNAVAKARAAGISTSGKVYNPTMAGVKGAADPDAWISPAEGGMAHIRRVCEKNGTGFPELGIKANGKLTDNPKTPPKLAPHLAERLYREAVVENPDLGRRPKDEVKHELVEHHCK